MRHVLMSTQSSREAWTCALELSRALGERGLAVTLATLGAPLTLAQWAEARDVPGLRVEQSVWRSEDMPDAWDDVAESGAWLLELEARYLPDVVHLNGYCHGALPWKRKPLVVGHACPLARARREPRYLSEVSRGLRAAGHVVAPSHALLESLALQAGPLSSTSVIPPARRHVDFPPSPLREPFLFTTGAPWDEARNLEVLEAVAPRLDWPVLVAGAREHPAGGLVRSRALHLLGELPRAALAERLGRASLFVLPSREEPSGLAALGAALAGCALVLSDIPPFREMWEEAAVFVPPEDTEMWGRALRRLVSEPVLRGRMSTLARTRALEFSPERMADAYVALYGRMGEVSLRSAPSQPQLARAKTGADWGRSRVL
ncbi:glycosyltransferase family 4 protein [Cystobacter fuscus]|uniref:glycosyltransferase family 4 protein n=1 Tax=Cystobacter fuscus TaxID=43 RepID=UPI0037BF1C61